MTPATTDTADTGEQALAMLSAKIDMLPDEDDEPQPSERTRIAVRLQMLRTHRRLLSHAVDVCADIAPRIATVRQWRATLQAGTVEFERRLAEIEAGDDHRRARLDVQQALRTLHDGPEVFPSGELIPNLLHNWLTSHDVTMVNGCLFAGRGGLRSCEVRLAALEKEHDTARAELEFWIRAVESL